VTGCEYSQRDVRSAWAVHALTASGVIVGMVGLDAVIDGHARAAIIWLVVALVLDGVDGPIARKLEVRKRIPLLDGNALDLVIDYFTCVIVPVAFLDRFNILPDNTIAPTGFTILFVSALWMARTDQETPDGWFRGFPAEWNVIIPSLFLLDISRWFNLGVCAVLCVMTLSRAHFPHPVSVREQRPISLAFMFLWIGSMIWLAIAQHHITWLRILLVVAPLWTVWQVLNRARTRSRADAVITSGSPASPPT
jgi:phosphatidylcholine synthase